MQQMAWLGIAVAQCLLSLIVLDMAQPVGAAQGELVHASIFQNHVYERSQGAVDCKILLSAILKCNLSL